MDSQKVLILLPHTGIAIISWLQIVLSLNRFRGFTRPSQAEALGLVLYLSSALVRWITSLATQNSSFLIQVVSASMGSLMAFGSFVIVYNDRIDIPTRQQAHSFILVLVTTLLWEVINMMIVNSEVV